MIFETIVRIIADGAVIPVVLIGIYMLVFRIPKGGRYEAYCRILMAGLTAYLIAKIVGTIYQPSLLRPFELLGIEAGASFLDNPGFPSDHALFVTAITCAVWFETRHKSVSLVLAGLTLIVCIGRVLAFVHTPLDVVAGVIIGLVGALWYVNDRAASKKKTADTTFA